MVEMFTSVILSIIAGVTCHIICKWLDRKK